MRQRRNTLTAQDGHNGPVIHFDDYVYDGDLVEVEGVGTRVCYFDPAGPDWWLRPLNKTEREALIERVVHRAA